MAKVIGIGGVFIKAKDPEALRAWYREMLGVEFEEWGGVMFWSSPAEKTYTLLNHFKEDTTHFEPSKKEVMLNLRVDDLDALTAALRAKGVKLLDDRRQDGEYGKFGYVVDPEGTLLELWQPAATT